MTAVRINIETRDTTIDVTERRHEFVGPAHRNKQMLEGAFVEAIERAASAAGVDVLMLAAALMEPRPEPEPPVKVTFVPDPPIPEGLCGFKGCISS